jgi:hypothetical protein
VLACLVACAVAMPILDESAQERTALDELSPTKQLPRLAEALQDDASAAHDETPSPFGSAFGATAAAAPAKPEGHKTFAMVGLAEALKQALSASSLGPHPLILLLW